jgi:haloacetate dehalogenase
MERLGHARFAVAGHDRGGRVAYRMALDHPEQVTQVAVLDVLPTSMVWERADAQFALAYWPWSMLAQPERVRCPLRDPAHAHVVLRHGSR